MQKSAKIVVQEKLKKIEPEDEDRVTDANSANMFEYESIGKNLISYMHYIMSTQYINKPIVNYDLECT